MKDFVGTRVRNLTNWLRILLRPALEPAAEVPGLRRLVPRLLDTGNNRSSAVNVSSPWRGLLPFPDGTVSQGDRQHSSFMYAGILAEAPAVSTYIPMTSMMMMGVGH